MRDEFEDVVGGIDAPRVTESITIGTRTWTRYENDSVVGWVEIGKPEDGDAT